MNKVPLSPDVNFLGRTRSPPSPTVRRQGSGRFAALDGTPVVDVKTVRDGSADA